MKKTLLLITIVSFYSCTTRVPYANKMDDLHNSALKLDPIWDYKPSLFTYAMAAGYAGAGLVYIKDTELKWTNLLVPVLVLGIVSRGPGITVNGKRINSVKYKHYDEWLTKLNKKNNKDYVFAEKDEDYVIVVPRFQLAGYLQHKRDLENRYNTGGSHSDFWSTALIVGGSLYLLYQGKKLFFGEPSKSNSTPKEVDGQLVEDKFCDYYLCLSYTCNTTGRMVRIRKISPNSDTYEVGVDSNLESVYSFQNALDLAIKQTNCK
jgi:hypothetical protein